MNVCAVCFKTHFGYQLKITHCVFNPIYFFVTMSRVKHFNCNINYRHVCTRKHECVCERCALFTVLNTEKKLPHTHTHKTYEQKKKKNAFTHTHCEHRNIINQMKWWTRQNRFRINYYIQNQMKRTNERKTTPNVVEKSSACMFIMR